MTYGKKLERANELFGEIKDREAELEALFGGEQVLPRRGRPRKEKENGRGESGSLETAHTLGADQATD
jgi:hypothetical protein